MIADALLRVRHKKKKKIHAANDVEKYERPYKILIKSEIKRHKNPV